MEVLLAAPNHYSVFYKINPWMNPEITVDIEKAAMQWQTLQHHLLQSGVSIKNIAPMDDVPDMVFTANAALIYNNIAFLSHFKHPERQKEENHFKKWFEENGYEIVSTAPYFFEGEGDALFSKNNTLFAGYGFRSDKEAYNKIGSITGLEVVLCELVDPYFYHLDTCLCFLDEYTAIWYPNAFSQKTQLKIQENINTIDVTREEAMHFCCNAIVDGMHIILPLNCPQLKSTLIKRGYTVTCLDMSEFIKAGGACKCLVLNLKP